MPKLTTGQPRFRYLVAHLTGGSDPSKGVSGNPQKARSSIELQHFPEVGREGEVLPAGTGKTPGLRTYTGLVSSGTPTAASATITVASTDFTSQATLLLGEYALISGADFSVGTTAVGSETLEDGSEADGVIAIWKTSGAAGGEGTLTVPVNLPLQASSVTISWTSGAAGVSQTDDGAGGFTGDGNPAGSSIDYDSGAIVLDTTGAVPDASSVISIAYTYSNSVAALTATIDGLPGFTASQSGNVITITGPTGVAGNNTRLEAEYLGATTNFTLTGFSGGAPDIGPPALT